MTKLLCIIPATSLLWLAAVSPATAQPDTDRPVTNGCSVQPPSSQSRPNEAMGEKLDRCGGVLVPPRVGDSEFVKPAPEEGTIRVIPPRALPEQQTRNSDGAAQKGVPN